MNQEEIQELWDMSLLSGWKADRHMATVLKRFLKIVAPEQMESNGEFVDISEAIVYLESLGLSRCYDKKNTNDGVVGFIGIRDRARPFIAARCEDLNNCLWNKDNSIMDIIDAMDRFKWRRKGKSARKSYGKQYAKYKRACGEKTIKARSLGKKHDWDTVK